MNIIVQKKANIRLSDTGPAILLLKLIFLFLLLYSNVTVAKGFKRKYVRYTAVSGQVTDGKNQPLAGVSVNVKGTTAGTSTTGDGRFTIDVANNNDTLVFTYVGYVSQEVPLEGRPDIS